MILNHERFQGFATKPLADPAKGTAVMLAVSQDGGGAVDVITKAALQAGVTERKPAQDMGFMYSRTFRDPDGNVL